MRISFRVVVLGALAGQLLCPCRMATASVEIIEAGVESWADHNSITRVVRLVNSRNVCAYVTPKPLSLEDGRHGPCNVLSAIEYSMPGIMGTIRSALAFER